MPKAYYLRNAGKSIEKSDVRQLRNLASENTPTRVIGFKMGRSEASVRSMANGNNISLRPTNQAPYNRKK